MAQAYSNPKRASDPYSLPDVETFYVTAYEHLEADCPQDEDGAALRQGWYWQACFPGCLPDGNPMGPFGTEAEALADAQADRDLE